MKYLSFEKSLKNLLQQYRLTNPVGPRRLEAYIGHPDVVAMTLVKEDYNGIAVQTPAFLFKDGEKLPVRLWYPADVILWKKYHRNLGHLEQAAKEIVNLFNQELYIDQIA